MEDKGYTITVERLKKIGNELVAEYPELFEECEHNNSKKGICEDCGEATN